MLRVRDVASRLNCSLSTVYVLIENGRLPAHRVGLRKGIRVSEEDLRAYLERNRGIVEQPRPASRVLTGTQFRHLDGERLRAAWQRQGVPFDRTGADSAPSSGS
jgi:excisionase family DNA binding protein